jgi:hypothetical protein
LCSWKKTSNVAFWGVPNQPSEADPIVEQGMNSESDLLEWHSEHTRCAEFLEVMLSWQACMGEAMKYVVGAPATLETHARLEAGFRFVGRLGELRAYACQDCALCFVEWQVDGFDYRVFAGFKTRKLQTTVGRELGLRWEVY